jgi:cation diffusion facilitator CzcD-associated flavoprotein CzcO
MPTPREPLDVLIVGAGISGIGMAAHLTPRMPGQALRHRRTARAAGGTWEPVPLSRGVRSDSDMFTLGYASPLAPGRARSSAGEAILGYLAR